MNKEFDSSRIRHFQVQLRNQGSESAKGIADLVDCLIAKHGLSSPEFEKTLITDAAVMQKLDDPLYPAYLPKIKKQIKILQKKRTHSNSLKGLEDAWIQALTLSVLRYYKIQLKRSAQAMQQQSNNPTLREFQTVLFSLHGKRDINHIPKGIAQLSDPFLKTALSAFKKKMKAQEMKKQIIIFLYQLYIVSNNKSIRRIIAKYLSELLYISPYKRKIATYTPLANEENLIYNAMKKNELIDPIYSTQSKLLAVTKVKVIEALQQTLSKPASAKTVELQENQKESFDLLYSLNNLTPMEYPLKSTVLKRLISSSEKIAQDIHKKQYSIVKKTMYETLINPHSTARKILISKIPLISRFYKTKLNEDTHKIAIFFKNIGGHRYMAEVYRQFFTKENPNGPHEALNNFLKLTTDQFIKLQTNSIPNVDDKVKVKIILEPFREVINRFSNNHHLDLQIEAIKVSQKHDIDKIVFNTIPRNKMTFKKVNNEKTKRIVEAAGTIVTIMVAIGQVGITAFSVWSFFPILGITLGIPLLVVCSLSSFYTVFLGFHSGTTKFIQDFFLKKGLWNSRAEPLVKKVKLLSFIGAIGIASTNAFLAFSSILLLPIFYIIPIITGIFAFIVSFGTALCFNANTYHNTLRFYAKVVILWKKTMENGCLAGCKGVILRFFSNIKEKLLCNENVTADNRSTVYKKRISYLAGNIVGSIIAAGGFLLFLASSLIILRTWHVDTVKGLELWFRLTPVAATAVSAVVVLGISGLVNTLNNAKAFFSFTLKCINKVNQKITDRLVSILFLVGNKRGKIIADIAENLSVMAKGVRKKFQKSPGPLKRKPRKRIGPFIKTFRNKMIHLGIILFRLMGTAAFILKASLPSEASSFKEIKTLSFIRAGVGLCGTDGSTQVLMKKIQKFDPSVKIKQERKQSIPLGQTPVEKRTMESNRFRFQFSGSSEAGLNEVAAVNEVNNLQPFQRSIRAG